jgi:release factor glutamine methyltransferase
MRTDTSIVFEDCNRVYPPAEDSYLLLGCVEVEPGERILDMGCGTGLIALHCARTGGIVTAADINPKAVECTRRNAKLNGLDVQVVPSDLFLDIEGEFDLIVFNPPYVPDEIKGDLERSWAGGDDGVRVLHRFLRAAPAHLANGGRILVLLSTAMGDEPLQCALSPFVRERLAAERLFFEEIWVERLSLP